MVFENHTPFPAIAWLSVDNHGKEYSAIVARIKYRFDAMDEEGLWTLKLDPDQGKLFGEDIFYEDNMDASVRYESDYVDYKPHADLIINAYARALKPSAFWKCGAKAVRYSSHSKEPETLVEQWLKVYGKRYWQEDILGWRVGEAEPTTQVSLRYENAFGGVVLDPYADDDAPYAEYYKSNPIGKGLMHKILAEEGKLELPQIEAVNEPVERAYMPYAPQGLGFINRSWQPRLALAGRFDATWEQEKHPLMPDDYQEAYNNGAHPALQLKEYGYFQAGDAIVLHKLLANRETQAFRIPAIHLHASYHIEGEALPFELDIDTVIVDILEEEMADNVIYISYRSRAPYTKLIEKVSLDMLVPSSLIENPPKKKETQKEETYV